MTPPIDLSPGSPERERLEELQATLASDDVQKDRWKKDVGIACVMGWFDDHGPAILARMGAADREADVWRAHDNSPMSSLHSTWTEGRKINSELIDAVAARDALTKGTP